MNTMTEIVIIYENNISYARLSFQKALTVCNTKS